MNRSIGMISSFVNGIYVIGFAVCMILGFDFGSFIACMFIAFSFVPMISAFCNKCDSDRIVAGYSAIAFSCIYAVIILLVYFAQVTAVRLDDLNGQAAQIIDYKKFGLFFSYDLLGYGIMALSTFFIGLTIKSRNRRDKWLKWLLIIHGVFFISCLIIPMLGLFSTDMNGADWIGVLVLEFWCAYFAPISILSFLHFKNVDRFVRRQWSYGKMV